MSTGRANSEFAFTVMPAIDIDSISIWLVIAYHCTAPINLNELIESLGCHSLRFCGRTTPYRPLQPRCPSLGHVSSTSSRRGREKKRRVPVK